MGEARLGRKSCGSPGVGEKPSFAGDAIRQGEEKALKCRL